MKFSPLSTTNCVSALALSMGLMLPMHAVAQTAEGDAPAAAEDQESVQNVVYVTARKRQETQLEVPVSVTAFSQASLDERGITNASELSDFVPGFDFENVGTGGASGRANPQIRFRGVGVQIGDANARAGAIFWDGAYVADGIGIVPLIDLAQTEVIKGPQTAFFGRNTFAGAANFIPAVPTDSFEGKVSAAVTGTDVDNGYNIHGVFSGPITDKLSGRLALSSEKRAASYEFGDGSPLGEEETYAILGSLKYDVSDNTSLDYSGYFVDSRDTSALSSINADVDEADCNRTYSGNLRNITTGEDLGPFSTNLSDLPGSEVNSFATLLFFADDATLFCGSVPDWGESNQINPAFGGAPAAADQAASGFTDNNTLPDVFGSDFIEAPGGLGNTYETYRHHLSMESELDSGFTLAGFVSIGQNQNWGTFDSAYGAGAVPTYRGFIRETEDLSAEARISSPGDSRLRYTLGASYYTQEAQTYQTGFNILTAQEAEVVGIFGALDYDLTDALTFSAEGRWQDDTSDLLQDGPPGSAFDAQSQSYSKFMPRVILSYQPAGLDLNVYANYSQSYLAGTQTGATSYAAAVPGFDASSVGFFTPIQKLDAFEIGVKQRLNDKFQYAIAAYNMQWENQAFFVLSPTFVSIALAGDSEYTGIETEFDYSPTDWLTILGSYNWVDAEFTDYVATGSVGGSVLAPTLLSATTAIDATGNTIRYIPEHTGAISANIDLDVGSETFLRADAIYTGSFFVDNFEYNEVDAAVKVNLRAGTSISGVRVEMYGNNIFDDRTAETSGGTTYTSFFSQNTRRMFGQATRGTELGLRLTADF